MPLNHYVTLGRSGLKVSAFCLGGMTFGLEWKFGSDEATSRQIIDYYLDQGGNFIDTANAYTRGTSETIIGNHLGPDPAKRDRVVLATKFSSNLHPGDPNAGGAGRKALIAACEESLTRLRTDYIDLYWIHWYDPHTPIEETLRALDDLVASGKVRFLGISDTPAWKVAQAHVIAYFRGWSPLIALQIQYSLLERTVEGELIPMACDLGLGVTPWSPLRGGVLSGKYTRERMQAESPGRAVGGAGLGVAASANERTFNILDVVVKIARMHGSTPARVALAWVRSRPGVASPIIGARTLAQLTDNIAAADLTLTSEDIRELDTVSAPQLNFPAEFLNYVHTSSYGGFTVNGRSYPVNPLLNVPGKRSNSP